MAFRVFTTHFPPVILLSEKPILDFLLSLSLFFAFGMLNLVPVLESLFPKLYGVFSPFRVVPPAVFTEMFSAGVRVSWEYLATADPAGFIVTAPKSPPSAVNAFPMANVLAVPS